MIENYLFLFRFVFEEDLKPQGLLTGRTISIGNEDPSLIFPRSMFHDKAQKGYSISTLLNSIKSSCYLLLSSSLAAWMLCRHVLTFRQYSLLNSFSHLCASFELPSQSNNRRVLLLLWVGSGNFWCSHWWVKYQILKFLMAGSPVRADQAENCRIPVTNDFLLHLQLNWDLNLPTLTFHNFKDHILGNG